MAHGTISEQDQLRTYLDIGKGGRECLQRLSVNSGTNQRVLQTLSLSWAPAIVKSLDELSNLVKPNVASLLHAASSPTCPPAFPVLLPNPGFGPNPNPIFFPGPFQDRGPGPSLAPDGNQGYPDQHGNGVVVICSFAGLAYGSLPCPTVFGSIIVAQYHKMLAFARNDLYQVALQEEGGVAALLQTTFYSNLDARGQIDAIEILPEDTRDAIYSYIAEQNGLEPSIGE